MELLWRCQGALETLAVPTSLDSGGILQEGGGRELRPWGNLKAQGCSYLSLSVILSIFLYLIMGVIGAGIQLHISLLQPHRIYFFIYLVPQHLNFKADSLSKELG